MESINLNLIPTGANPVVHVSQYDTGRVIRFNIFEGSSVYFLDGTETISCNIKKPDNNIVTLSVTNTNDSYVEITTTEQATACDGSNLCEISITKGDDVIGSLNFIMEVERSPIEGGISSASEINNLWTQVDGMVADALATQYDSANVVFDNLPTAGHGIPYTVTSEGIGNAIDNALDMTDTASGAIATFESEYALPLRDLEIEINAVQESGTPTPSSPKLISGFTGANIIVNGKNFIDVSIGNLESGTINGSTGATEASNTRVRNTNFHPFPFDYLYEQGYKLTIPNGYKIAMRFYDKNGTYIPGMGWVIGFVTELADYFHNKGVCYAKFIFAKTDDSNITPSDIASVHYQLEIGTTATAYQAYNSTTTAISWQSEAGTVYGGSLDVTSGLLTVTHGYIDLGSLSWDYTAQGYGRSSTAITNPKLPASESTTANIICECLVANSANQVYSHNEGIAIDSASRVRVYWSTMPTTGSDIKTALNGQLLVYELATPQTYQLTPTQISAIVGTNNVFADTNGDTSLEYYTKRGEQTVRIAEGVAVDVINNKSIDTLNTTDKTVKGAINELEAGIADTYTKTEVDTALNLKFDNANRATTGTGTFAGLLNTADRVWLITAQRLSTNSTIMLIAHKQNNNFYFKEIVKDSGMEYNYNSENGSVVITYGGSTTGVYGGAYRLA